MTNLVFSLNVVLPLVIIIGLGWFLRWRERLSSSFLKVGNYLVFYVLLPARLIHSITSSPASSQLDASFILFAVTGVTFIFLLFWFLVSKVIKDPRECGAFVHTVFRSNYALYGIAVANNVYGSLGVAVATQILPFSITGFNVMAVILLSYYMHGSKHLSWKQLIIDMLKNPLILSCVSAFFCSATSYIARLYGVCFSQIGATATPLALILLGAQLYDTMQHGSGRFRLVFTATIMRLIVVPAITLSAAIALGFRNEKLIALMALFASPTAVTSFIMASNMNSDADLTAQIIATTTIASAFTIFIWIFLLRTFGFIL